MVEKNTFTILLYIKRKKVLKNGESPIYIRVTVMGERFEISAGMSVDADIWDSRKGRIKALAKKSTVKNQYLDNLKIKCVAGIALRAHTDHIGNCWVDGIQKFCSLCQKY